MMLLFRMVNIAKLVTLAAIHKEPKNLVRGTMNYDALLIQ
jgi:hypothetical protein